MESFGTFVYEEYNKIQFKYSYIVLTLFLATWIVSNIAAVKLVNFFGITLTGGFLAFPFTVAISTLIADVYGYKFSRQAIWCGLILNLTYLFFMNIINIMPNAPEWSLQDQFQKILVPQNRIFIASLVAFWGSGFFNSYIMAKLKYIGISLAPRTTISLMITITVDLSLFFLIAFVGDTSSDVLKRVFLFAFIKKFICEIIFLPFMWLLIDKFKQLEGYEVYDNKTDFNPFSMDNIYNLDSYRKTRKIHKQKNTALMP